MKEIARRYLRGLLTSGQFLYQMHQALSGASEAELKRIAEYLRDSDVKE